MIPRGLSPRDNATQQLLFVSAIFRLLYFINLDAENHLSYAVCEQLLDVAWILGCTK
uniref:Uncharacterized protein n=1 Tax=Physcomitrium patens TaxID=3218 RepID=A0A2K1IXJ7_PHYPA|nr:hypothetical protein PHYPA_023797 [Physcomitrium patens]